MSLSLFLYISFSHSYFRSIFWQIWMVLLSMIEEKQDCEDVFLCFCLGLSLSLLRVLLMHVCHLMDEHL
jgi:hypothetical protein